ncbi:MAG: glycosyl transferase family 2 [Acidobacteria bacterium]|nr:MAG: glycosyl transferase family 2 [Acidobacteriota bacterium]
MTALAFFWISVILIGYGHFGYPVLMRAWAVLRPRRAHGGRHEPAVSVLVVVHNEAAQIEGRIANLLTLDYPKDRLEIVVGSDGSTDHTAARAWAFEKPGVRIFAFHRRRGKTAVLNDLVPRCRGEIVVLADARQRFAAEALEALVRPFADPRVGAVGGELILACDRSATPVGRGVGVYWRLEKSIRLSESLVDSTVGATGAIYAIRRDLFDPIPDDTILDDVLIPMRIVRSGYRVLFEPAARAYDRPASSAGEEFVRKVRTIAGNFQMLARERWMLDPFRNRVWLQTLSHKGLRLLGPLLLGTALVTNLLLAGRPLYEWTLLAQGVFYAAALLGGMKGAARKLPLVAIPYLICLLNWATVVAFVRVLTGRQRVTWQRATI